MQCNCTANALLILVYNEYNLRTMKISHRINRFLVEKVAKSWFDSVEKIEDELMQNPDIILATNDSPERFDIPLHLIELPDEFVKLPGPPQGGLVIYKCLQDRKKLLKSVKNNPKQPKDNISPEELSQLEDYITKLGVGSFGYATIENQHLFKEKGVMYNNAIMLAIEMDSDKIQKAPSAETEYMVLKSYQKLGQIAFKLSKFMRNMGFAAHPSHALVGLALYPPLAEKAGIGYHGYHGLIINPKYGPRIRLGVVFTNITNLPVNPPNKFEWIAEYCKSCNLCIKKCPGNAILTEPIHKENGIITHIDNSKCLPYFASDDGCAICIKVCPFSKTDPLSLKKHALQSAEIVLLHNVA